MSVEILCNKNTITLNLSFSNLKVQIMFDVVLHKKISPKISKIIEDIY